jgi:Domain of unknown function DUF29
MSSTLYDRDLQLWIEQTIHLLANRDFEALDVEHLIEELIDLGKSEKNAVIGNLMILLAHLLKLKIQQDVPDSMKSSGYGSVLEHRQRVLNQLADTPSLKNFLEEAIAKAYPNGRKLAIKEGKLAKFDHRVPTESEYPMECPFSVEQILDEDFYGFVESL